MEGSRKEDVSLPKATLAKLVKELLPKDARVARDTHDLLMDCCLEFITLISSEANEICAKEEKKTISPEHVLQSLEVLGFGSYISEVQAVYDQYKAETLESPRAGSGKWSNKAGQELGMTEDEAIAAQQRMFAEARARMNSGQLPVADA
eukprot:TRINITY_DN35399_c0_g1_i1.p1 TRINITY_DN35399_c0_g1~~TRINITY_DN35399_c0_g1_i1.p1  ORF type:complete len:149 (-),score=47.58 TRINITY_DN35399_c0_g1_i1:39-485(-)